jgi:aromatic ring hydroxylase-like protein
VLVLDGHGDDGNGDGAAVGVGAVADGWRDRVDMVHARVPGRRARRAAPAALLGRPDGYVARLDRRSGAGTHPLVRPAAVTYSRSGAGCRSTVTRMQPRTSRRGAVGADLHRPTGPR